MGRRMLVVDGAGRAWERQLQDPQYDVVPIERFGDPNAALPDLVLIDAAVHADVLEQVRACRKRFPSLTVPVLVLGLTDPVVGTAAIDAGATDALADAAAGPRLDAHVRRVLRVGDAVRGLVDAERRRAGPTPPDLARAAADVAKPLGLMLDGLEAAMARDAAPGTFDTLLEQLDQAVGALERLRRLTAAGGSGSDDPAADTPPTD